MNMSEDCMITGVLPSNQTSKLVFVAHNNVVKCIYNMKGFVFGGALGLNRFSVLQFVCRTL